MVFEESTTWNSSILTRQQIRHSRIKNSAAVRAYFYCQRTETMISLHWRPISLPLVDRSMNRQAQLMVEGFSHRIDCSTLSAYIEEHESLTGLDMAWSSLSNEYALICFAGESPGAQGNREKIAEAFSRFDLSPHARRLGGPRWNCNRA
jgi:hypothetical protein